MRTILAIILFTGCLNREELSPSQQEIVDDYKEWIGENSHHVQDELTPRVDRLFDMREIASQSARAEYYQRHGARNEHKAGQAQIKAEIIDIFADHYIWQFVERDYDEGKRQYDECESPTWAYRFSIAVGILSHENAHLVNRDAPHPTVYKLGETCESVAEFMLYEQWRLDCIDAKRR